MVIASQIVELEYAHFEDGIVGTEAKIGNGQQAQKLDSKIIICDARALQELGKYG